jgi:hypothetical protein
MFGFLHEILPKEIFLPNPFLCFLGCKGKHSIRVFSLPANIRKGLCQKTAGHIILALWGGGPWQKAVIPSRSTQCKSLLTLYWAEPDLDRVTR